jgi:hypothetical protein
MGNARQNRPFLAETADCVPATDLSSRESSCGSREAEGLSEDGPTCLEFLTNF